MSRVCRLVLVACLAVVGGSLGCKTGKYESNFQVIVQNRVANALAVSANGQELGQVASNQQGTFTIRLEESNANTFSGGVAPTPQGAVTLTARDVRTNGISTAKDVTVSQGTPTYVSFTAADFPAVTPAVARFTTSPNNPGVGQDVQFNASSSTPAAGSSFAWSFGDGTTGTGVTVTRAYAQTGSYLVTMTMTTQDGRTATSTATVTVTTNIQGGGQTANFTVSPSAPAVGQTVYFNASTSTVNGGTYSWNFGDGSTATGLTPTHAFGAPGTYTVTLRVTNPQGQSAATSRTVTVAATSPTVSSSFTFSPNNPGPQQDVLFDASASRPTDGTYVWTFGDGTSGSGRQVTHRYGQAGNYTVTLVVSNQFGQSAASSRNVNVTATSPQVVASFTLSPANPGMNQPVFFNASASLPTNATFNWTFGDGNTATGVMPTHTYTAAGTYTVTLTVRSSTGQQASTTRTLTVTTATVVGAAFTFSPTDPSITRSTNNVIFDASPSTGTITAYTWDFGDGSPTASGARTTHTFTRAGTWVVRLTVSNASGITATTTQNVTVAP